MQQLTQALAYILTLSVSLGSFAMFVGTLPDSRCLKRHRETAVCDVLTVQGLCTSPHSEIYQSPVNGWSHKSNVTTSWCPDRKLFGSVSYVSFHCKIEVTNRELQCQHEEVLFAGLQNRREPKRAAASWGALLNTAPLPRGTAQDELRRVVLQLCIIST